MDSELEQLASPDGRSLAEPLIPLLAEACGGRLGSIVWFKADWQRGGAATGTCTWRVGGGRELPAVIKIPIGQRELLWTQRLQSDDDDDPVVPRLYGSGEALGGYDLAWIVIERFEHGPLGRTWSDNHLPRIAEAIARFHAAARRWPVDQPPRTEPWDELLEKSRESVRTNGVPEKVRWNKALKTMRGRLGEFVEQWRARPVDDWLHGDAHIANAMSRHGLDKGTVSLIDLAEVHAGHWIEDAVYLERQLWPRPERMQTVKPVKAIAEARKRLGLPVGEDYPQLATIRRALLAATAPCYLRSEGSPKYLEACLERLEAAL